MLQKAGASLAFGQIMLQSCATGCALCQIRFLMLASPQEAGLQSSDSGVDAAFGRIMTSSILVCVGVDQTTCRPVQLLFACM